VHNVILDLAAARKRIAELNNEYERLVSENMRLRDNLAAVLGSRRNFGRHAQTQAKRWMIEAVDRYPGARRIVQEALAEAGPPLL
jgi:hypothetical protein